MAFDLNESLNFNDDDSQPIEDFSLSQISQVLSSQPPLEDFHRSQVSEALFSKPRPPISGAPINHFRTTGLFNASQGASSVCFAGFGRPPIVPSRPPFHVNARAFASEVSMPPPSSNVARGVPSSASVDNMPSIVVPNDVPATSTNKDAPAIVKPKAKKKSSQKARRTKLADIDVATNHGNWSLEEFRVLADSKLQLDNFLNSPEGRGKCISWNDRWKRVADSCKEAGVVRTPLQCMDKWDNVFPKFRKIRDWDKAIPSGMNSWSQMDPDEREAKGFARQFDSQIFEILEARFATDILVEPGPIIVDSSTTTFNNCNANVVEDISSSGKKRAQKQGRSAGVKRDFQDISKNLMDIMEKQSEARMCEQRRQVEDLLIVQERQAKAAEDQAATLQGSIAKLTEYLGAYMARQP